MSENTQREIQSMRFEINPETKEVIHIKRGRGKPKSTGPKPPRKPQRLPPKKSDVIARVLEANNITNIEGILKAIDDALIFSNFKPIFSKNS